MQVRFSLKTLYSGYLIALCCWSCSVLAEEVEFDERFLGIVAGQPVADLSKYRLGNPIPTGQYQVDVYVNGVRQGETKVVVEENAQDPIQGICLTPMLAEVLALKSAAFAIAPNHPCVNIVQAIPDGKIQFDLGMLALNLDIPQIFVQNRPRGYVPPSLWQTSTPVVFVDYRFSQFLNRSRSTKTDSRYLSLRSGANLGNWSLRHQGSKAWFDQQSKPYQYQHTYLMRDIDFLKGRLTLGDFATSGQFFGSFYIRGAQIASDEQMLPASQRGYAPVIEGIAQSNARVVVRQNHHIIYETTVPAGPFRIDDLYPSGYSGDLTVEILEADGQVRTFNVPVTSSVRLLRQGQLQYRIAGGRLRQGTQLFPETVFQGEIQYGLSNGLTLNLGANISRNYAASLAGVVFDTPIGTISSDLVYSRYQFPHLAQHQQKYALNVGYTARVPKIGAYLSASYYRSFSPENYSLDQVLEINRNGKLLPKSDPLQQRFAFSVSQPLGNNWGSFGISGSRQQFWKSASESYEYQINYGNSYKNFHYQADYAFGKSAYSNRKDKRFSLSFSFMFGGGATRPTLYSRYQKTAESYLAQTSLTGVLGQDNQFNYSISAIQQPNQRQYALHSGYKTSMATLNMGVSKSAQQQQQMNFGISGAVVAHTKGITLSHDLGDSFAIIHAKGAKGAKINNSNGSTLDWFGNGIVPYISPYHSNYIGIDPTEVPDDVEVEATGQEIIPRANSAVFVEFKTKSGKMALFDVTLENGDYPPMAAEVFSQQDQLIGYVVQGGRVFVRGVAEEGTLKVVWGSSEREQCQFSYQLSEDRQYATAVLCQ